MIPSTHIQIPPYSSEVSCIGAYGSDPKPPVGDAQAFARILLPLAASKPAANEIVENTTAPCQENGASMRADCHLDDENEADRQGINQEKARDQKNEKQNDNNILAAIMASCSNKRP